MLNDDSARDPDPLGLEAERAVETWRRRDRLRKAMPKTRRAIWSCRMGGAIVAMALNYASGLVGGDDSAVGIFGLSLLGAILGLAFGSGLRKVRATRMALTGEAIVGYGVGSAVAFASIFLIPVVRPL